MGRNLRLLLDTHALIWWLLDDPALGRAAYRSIGDEGNEVFVSAASAWEVTTKFRLGKLPEAAELAFDFEAIVLDRGFLPLGVTIGHAALAGRLVIPHKDPFDRLLIAQAQMEGLTLVSNEDLFDGFGVQRLW